MRLLSLLVLLLSLPALLLALVGHPAARAWLDPLAADGSLEALSAARYAILRLPLLAAGLAGLLLGGLSYFYPARVRSTWKNFWAGFPRLAAGLHPLLVGRSQWTALLGLTALAFLLRLPFLDQPLSHDEAYTYIGFARRSLAAVISDYHLPNNHVFHSLLVHISTRLLGDAPWALRLPVFLAGVLIVPAGYALGRILYNRRAGLLAAGLLAVTPLLITGSADARGYPLMALFSLLAWTLGAYLKTRPVAASWAALIMLGALGFFTVPVMVYPLGSLGAWLLLSVLREPEIAQAYGSRWRFIACLAASTALTALLGLLLYLPVMLVSGPDSLFANPFVQPLAWDAFPVTLGVRLAETWREWQFDVPPLLTVLAVIGFLLELALARRLTRHQVPAQLGVLAWMLPVLLIQRPNAFRKTWVWLLALLLIWAAAGWTLLLDYFRARNFGPRWLPNAASAAALIALALASLSWAWTRGPALAQPWSAELTANAIAGNIQPGGIVLVESAHGPPIWYYLLRAGQPPSLFDGINRRSQYSEAYVIVDQNEPGQDLAAVIARAGPQSPSVDPRSCRLLEVIQPFEIYLCRPDE